MDWRTLMVSAEFQPVCGVDEAGRGPLAGPVVAAACILPEGWGEGQLDDSKRLTEKRRDTLFEQLVADPAVQISVAIVEAEEIDDLNILEATMVAMQRSVTELSLAPALVLVDGNKIPNVPMAAAPIIKGDQLVPAISAASILAKVTRDRLMVAYDRQWPEYGFAQNKGYGTAKHRQALQEHGCCPIHRKSFAPVRDLLCQLSA